MPLDMEVGRGHQKPIDIMGRQQVICQQVNRVSNDPSKDYLNLGHFPLWQRRHFSPQVLVFWNNTLDCSDWKVYINILTSGNLTALSANKEKLGGLSLSIWVARFQLGQVLAFALLAKTGHVSFWWLSHTVKIQKLLSSKVGIMVVG